jgi:hypothetical protein
VDTLTFFYTEAALSSNNAIPDRAGNQTGITLRSTLDFSRCSVTGKEKNNFPLGCPMAAEGMRNGCHPRLSRR